MAGGSGSSGIEAVFIFNVSLLLLAFVAGVAALGAGGLSGSRRWVVAGAVTVALVVGVIVSSWYALEWNPIEVERDEVVGTWRKSGKVLWLGSDHRYTYRAGSSRHQGTWELEGCDLKLGKRGLMRFIRYRGELRLLTEPPGDPEYWDGDLGLAKAGP